MKKEIGGWFCANVDSKQIRRANAPKGIRKELRRIFCDDLEDVHIAGTYLDKDNFVSATENYIFIKVKDYYSHLQELRRSKIIVGVLDDYSDPKFIDEGEVLGFIAGLKGGGKKFVFADVVHVKQGYLKGLRGIVLRDIGNGYYRIFFRLYTRQFCERMHGENLEFEANIVNRMRVAVTKDWRRQSSTKGGKRPVIAGAIDSEVAYYLREVAYENSLRR